MSALGPVITLVLSLASWDRPQWMERHRGDEVRFSDAGEWVEHKLLPRETVAELAVRYGVSVDQILQWNHLSTTKLKRGRKLKIRAHRIPPPKEKVDYTVLEGDSWGRIAANWGVDTKDLHGWNFRTKELEPGETLKIFFDPAPYWTVGRKLGPLPNHEMVPDGALSYGRPQKGKIIDALALPPSPDYTCRSDRMCFGSSYTLQGLQRAFANFRYESGYEGEIIIGSISRHWGRRFPPHKSHQSGRDVDIRLPILPLVPDWRDPTVEEIDWLATWYLIESLIDTGRVDTIFLEADLQRNLYEAARRLGRSHEYLAPLITYPNDIKSREFSVVRHSKGHTAHIHVRFGCGSDDVRCKG